MVAVRAIAMAEVMPAVKSTVSAVKASMAAVKPAVPAAKTTMSIMKPAVSAVRAAVSAVRAAVPVPGRGWVTDERKTECHRKNGSSEDAGTTVPGTHDGLLRASVFRASRSPP